MKKFIATFWRGNPQLLRGGYEMKKTIEARTIEAAKRKAEKLAEKTVYGSMRLLDIEPEV